MAACEDLVGGARGFENTNFKCRRCRKISARDELVGKWDKSGWTDNCCPNCGCKTFTLVEPEDA